MADNIPAIEVKSITKEYKVGRFVKVKVLKGVNLTVERGDFGVIYGASGCGKSTLLGLIGGLEPPTTGEIVVEGQDINKLKPKQASAFRCTQVGIVFQQFNLVPTLSAEDNIALPLLLERVKRGEALKRAREILKIVGLTERAKHKPSALSGGEQQRVAIGRAIVANPPILLVDEPTGNLDSENGRVVIDILRKIHSWGKTILLVTHNREFAKYGSKIYTMSDGRITGSSAGQASRWREKEGETELRPYDGKKSVGGLTRWEVMRVAKSHFLSNKLRVIFTTMGVMLGIGSIVALVSLGVGLQKVTSNQIASFNALVSVSVTKTPNSALPLDESAVANIKKLEHVKLVSPQAIMPTKGTFEGTTTSLLLTGINSDAYEFEEVNVTAGNTDGAVINKAGAKSYNIREYKSLVGKGLVLELLPLGSDDAASSMVAQLLASTEKNSKLEIDITGASDDELIAAVYAPLDKVMKAAGLKEYTSIKVQAEDRKFVKDIRTQIEDMGFATTSVVDMIDQVDKVFTIVQVALGTIGAIALIVALIGIINTMTLALLERTHEIGILKAVGASNGDIRRIFLYESALFGLVGGILGVGSAWLVGQGINSLLDYMVRTAGSKDLIHIFITPRSFAIEIVFISIFVAMLAGWYPSRRAARLSAMEALRYE